MVEESKKTHYWIGSSCLLIALLLFGGLGLRYFVWGAYPNKNGYHGHFTDIGSLQVHSPVKLCGVRVGRVAKVELIRTDSNGFLADVTFVLDKPLLLPSDATGLSIQTTGLMGEAYLQIVVDSFVRRHEQNEPVWLKPGEKIEKTQSAISFEGLVKEFKSLIMTWFTNK